MKIKILFDRDTINPDLHTGWGISFIIDSHILFDTGEKFEYISANAKAMNIDLNQIDTVVISHEHWDHINGLWEILKMKPGIKVYGCPGFSNGFKEKVSACGGVLEDVASITKIAENIHILGGNRVVYKGNGLSEQMITLKTDKGFVVVCACCHPGIVNIVHKATAAFGLKVDTVVGGLHMIDKDKRFTRYALSEMKMYVDNVYSSHCTGYDAEEILKELYGEKAVVLKTGMEIEV